MSKTVTEMRAKRSAFEYYEDNLHTANKNIMPTDRGAGSQTWIPWKSRTLLTMETPLQPFIGRALYMLMQRPDKDIRSLRPVT